MCHADEQLFHQRERLLGLLPHPQRVTRQGRHPDDGHPPMNPAKQRRRLVGREIVAGPNLEQHQDVAQCTRVVEVIGRLRPIHLRQPGEIRADPRRHLLHRQHDINKAGRDGVARHIAVFGLAGILRDREAAMFLDALESSRTVGTSPGQNHADRPRTVRLGKRTKKDVHWRSTLFRASEFRDGQVSVEDRQASVRRDDVDVIRLERSCRRDLGHWKRERHLQDFRQLAVVVGRQVQNDHVGHGPVRRHMRKELPQRRDATRGRTQADDHEPVILRRLARRLTCAGHHCLARTPTAISMSLRRRARATPDPWRLAVSS